MNIDSDDFVFEFDKLLKKCNGLRLTKRNILSVAAWFFRSVRFYFARYC